MQDYTREFLKNKVAEDLAEKGKFIAESKNQDLANKIEKAADFIENLSAIKGPSYALLVRHVAGMTMLAMRLTTTLSSTMKLADLAILQGVAPMLVSFMLIQHCAAADEKMLLSEEARCKFTEDVLRDVDIYMGDM